MALRGETILARFNNAHAVAEGIMKEIGVDVHYNCNYKEGDTFKTAGGADYSYVLDCRGFKYNGPKHYLQGDMAQCVDKKTGQILINAHGQMTNLHPLTSLPNTSEPKTWKNIFSYGDVCLSHANEVKSIVSMFQYGHVISANMLAKDGSELLSIPKEMCALAGIPIGRTHGIFCFNAMATADPTAFAQKCDIRATNMGVYKNDAEMILKSAESGKMIGTFLGMATGSDDSVPMHISKNREF